jgi:hypothetical protein
MKAKWYQIVVFLLPVCPIGCVNLPMGAELENGYLAPGPRSGDRWDGIEPIYSARGFIGSGFHVGDSLIVTADHVIDGETNITVNGVTAEIVMRSPSYDIAVLRVPGYTGRAYSLADAKLGEPAFYRAYTSSYAVKGEQVIDQVVTAGRISSLNLGGVIGYDGGLHPGMSGGPIFNAHGEVVAMGGSCMAWMTPPFPSPNSIMGRGVPASWIKAAVMVAKENQNAPRFTH